MNNKEITIVYLAQITEILRNVPEDTELTVKDLAENKKQEAGNAIKEKLGVDDAVVTEVKYFVRDLPSEPAEE